MKKRLIWIGAALVCLIAAVVLFYLRSRSLLDRKIAELRVQGLPTSFAELEAKYKLPAGTPNAADIYLKAFAAYQPLEYEKQNILPVLGSRSEPNDKQPYPAEEIAAAGEFVGFNQEMFGLLHQAGAITDCYYPMDYSIGVSNTNSDIWRGIKRGSQSLLAAAIYYSQTGRPDKAFEAIVDQMRLAQSMSRNPSTIDHLIYMALLGLAVSGAEDVVNRTTLEQAQLQQLQDMLGQISESISIRPALCGEICFYLEYLDYPLQAGGGGISGQELASRCAARLLPGTCVNVLDAYQQMIEADALPAAEQWPRQREIIRQAQRAGLLKFLNPYALGGIEHIFGIHMRIRAIIDSAIMSMAVERYRLQEGKLPETADTLAPEYLPRIYLDPFDGKPLRYKQTEPGYMIYTIGEDGVDDGGDEIRKGAKTYDWAFRVYR